MAVRARSVDPGWLLAYPRISLLATFEQQEPFEVVTSMAAVAFVAWMIFWMRRAARSIAGDLRARLAVAIAIGPLVVGLTSHRNSVPMPVRNASRRRCGGRRSGR